MESEYSLQLILLSTTVTGRGGVPLQLQADDEGAPDWWKAGMASGLWVIIECNKVSDWWKAGMASGLWVIIKCNKVSDWWKAGMASGLWVIIECNKVSDWWKAGLWVIIKCIISNQYV